MKKISGSTFLLKKLVAAFLLIFWGSWLITPFLPSDDEFPLVLAVVLFVVGGFIWFWAYKQTIGDLADIVYDNGDELIFHKGNREQRVNIRDILNISFQNIILLQRITVHVRSKGAIGEQLVFSPPVRLFWFKQNTLISELIERVGRARNTQRDTSEQKTFEIKKISGSTFYEKKVIPTFWFGFCALYLVICFLVSFFANNDESFLNSLLIFSGNAVGITIFAAIGYIAGIRSAWALVDEVYEDGDQLVFRKGRKEQHVNLRDIININYSQFRSPKRITIYTRSEGSIGKELAFKPPMRINIFTKNPLFLHLIERVDRARNI